MSFHSPRMMGGGKNRRARRTHLTSARRRRLWMEPLEQRAMLSVTVNFETTKGNFQVELFDDVAPITVANFLNYVTSGRYDGTFVHRSINNFVVQGGSFTYVDGEGVSPIAVDGPIKNEFNLSNLRGTLAMAKADGDPNSAQSSWFINLKDNSDNLDNQNGGFTVFGQVIGNGMSVVDAIAALPTYAFGEPFANVPLQNYTTYPNPLPTATNFIFYTHVTIVGDVPPILVPTDSATQLSATEHQEFTKVFAAAEFNTPHKTLTYSLEPGAPAGATINPTTGEFKWTPGENDGGTTKQFTVRVTNSSNQFDTLTATISVQEFNDAPLITSPSQPFTLLEAGSVALLGFSISDPDAGNLDVKVTLQVAHGTINVSDTVQGGLITSQIAGNNSSTVVLTGPIAAINATLAASTGVTYLGSADFAGLETLNFTVNDLGHQGSGAARETSKAVALNVTPVNDAPSFSLPTASATANEDSAAVTTPGFVASILAGPPDEASQAVTFQVDNDNPSLFSAQPSISPQGTLTFTPAPNAFGTATVTVRLKDNGGTENGGDDTSEAQTFVINILSVNDAPTFVLLGSDVTIDEDAAAQTLPEFVGDAHAGAENESGQTISYVVTNSNNDLFAAQPSIDANGALSFTPAPNAFGTATVTVRAKDSGGTDNGGIDLSVPKTFTITITPQNDPPSAVDDEFSVQQESDVTSIPVLNNDSIAPDADEELTILSVSTGSAGGSISVAPDGKSILYKPAAGFRGFETFSYVVNDGTEGSNATANVNVRVSAKPTAEDDTFTVNEDSTTQLDVLGNDSTLPDTGETLHIISVGAGSQGGSIQISQDGLHITYKPAENFHGTETFTYTINDGTPGSDATATVTVTVQSVNDAPTFDVAGDQQVAEDASQQTIPGAILNLSPGPADEQSQTLSIHVGNDRPDLFAVQPAIAADGTLTYTPAANAVGVATITVFVSDSGGTANGGVNTSSTKSFTISIQAVNDAPSFAVGPDQSLSGNAAPQTVNEFVTGVAAGPADETGQQLQFVVTNDNPALFSVQPTIGPNGTLTYTPASGAKGTALVTVQLVDDGGTLNGGIDTSLPQLFSIVLDLSDALDLSQLVWAPDLISSLLSPTLVVPGGPSAVTSGGIVAAAMSVAGSGEGQPPADDFLSRVGLIDEIEATRFEFSLDRVAHIHRLRVSPTDENDDGQGEQHETQRPVDKAVPPTNENQQSTSEGERPATRATTQPPKQTGDVSLASPSSDALFADGSFLDGPAETAADSQKASLADAAFDNSALTEALLPGTDVARAAGAATVLTGQEAQEQDAQASAVQRDRNEAADVREDASHRSPKGARERVVAASVLAPMAAIQLTRHDGVYDVRMFRRRRPR